MLSGWLMLLKLPDGPKNPVITHPAPAIDLPSSDIADEGVATPWPEAGLKLALVPRSWPQNRPSIKATCLLTPKAHSWPYKGFLYIYIYHHCPLRVPRIFGPYFSRGETWQEGEGMLFATFVNKIMKNIYRRETFTVKPRVNILHMNYIGSCRYIGSPAFTT